MPEWDAVMEELKLVALDKDDVEVMSAHLQDALVKVGDIFWRPGERRFVMAVNRFDWMNAVDADALKIKSPEYRRCRTALRFERVEFTEHDAPAGTVTMTFSGGGAIRLEVECLEAELVDLGEVFAAMACPHHFTDTKVV
jgi:hypothetical protein